MRDPRFPTTLISTELCAIQALDFNPRRPCRRLDYGGFGSLNLAIPGSVFRISSPSDTLYMIKKLTSSIYSFSLWQMKNGRIFHHSHFSSNTPACHSPINKSVVPPSQVSEPVAVTSLMHRDCQGSLEIRGACP